jgi:hypothetical protein
LNVCVLGDKTGVIVRLPPIFDGGYSVRHAKYPSRKIPMMWNLLPS